MAGDAGLPIVCKFCFIDRTKRLYQLLVNLASLTGQRVMTSWKSNKLNLDYKVCVYKGNKCGNLLGGTSA